MKTIKDVEVQLQEQLGGVLKELGLLREGYRCRVRLHGKTRDKRRSASFETSWSPDTDSIRIQLKLASEEPHQEGPQPVAQGAATTAADYVAKANPAPRDPLFDLIRALDRAESRPGYAFVALKWFRDTELVAGAFSWATTDSVRQTVLRDAIDKRLILTSKVPNPKSPQFPVTAIRLNRLMPEVKTTLGSRDDEGSGFQPVPIRGEDLSVTVLRDRR
ncbi:MAG: hypothetical protein ACRD1N_05450 [Terriglobia bacterium]